MLSKLKYKTNIESVVGRITVNLRQTWKNIHIHKKKTQQLNINKRERAKKKNQHSSDLKCDFDEKAHFMARKTFTAPTYSVGGGNKRAEGMRKIEIKMELLFMQVSVARLLRKND